MTYACVFLLDIYIVVLARIFVRQRLIFMPDVSFAFEIYATLRRATRKRFQQAARMLSMHVSYK